VRTRRVVDAVAPAACGASLQPDQLVEQLEVVKQVGRRIRVDKYGGAAGATASASRFRNAAR